MSNLNIKFFNNFNDGEVIELDVYVDDSEKNNAEYILKVMNQELEITNSFKLLNYFEWRGVASLMWHDLDDGMVYTAQVEES